MQNPELTNATAKRNSHLNSIRASLKASPLQFLCNKGESKVQQENCRKIKAFQKTQKDLTSAHSETEASESEEAELKVSQSFYQKYQVLEKLGQGCNACVYKCQDKITHKIYAVKKARLQEQHVEEAKQIFFNIKALKHPQISSYKALYYDSLQRLSFTVMEYCPFPNLSEAKIQTEQELKNIISQLVPVIQYLHQNNICHRDIKPENVLYDPKTKQIKLIDFGISKKTVKKGEKREMLTIIGSNCYLAPQIYLGGGYDQRVDLWCLGVTIFKLITGRTPFESQYHSQTIKNIVKGDIKFGKKAWEAYSPEVQSFVGNLLKGKDTRMTLKQCKQHPWLAQQKLSSF